MKLPKHPKIQQNDAGDLFLNFGEYGQEIELACFSADGTKLLTVKEVGLAEIWDLTSNESIRQIRPASPLEGSDKSPVGKDFKVFIESAALNFDGSLALLGLNDATARLFSVETGEELSIFFEPEKEPSESWGVIRSVTFSPDGKLALIGFNGRSVGVWDISNNTFVRMLTGWHSKRLFKEPFVRDTMVSSLSATADNRFVFAGFADMTATVWNLKTGEVVFDAYEHVEKILDVWISADKLRWATSGGSIYERNNSESARKILSTGEAWIEVKFSPDGDRFLARLISGEVKKWSMSGEQQGLTFAGNSFPYDAELLYWNPDDQTVICPHESKSLYFRTGEQTFISEARSDVICGIAVSSELNLAATHGWSKSIELWQTPTGEKVSEFILKDSAGIVTFSPCGKMIAAGFLGQGGEGQRRTIHIWNVETGERLFEFSGHTHQVHAIAFSPDSKWIVSAGLDRTVWFWNLSSDFTASPFGAEHLAYDDLEFKYLSVLGDGRVVVYRKTVIEIWKNGQKISIPVAYDYGTKWYITPDENHIIGTYRDQMLIKYSLRSAAEEPEIIQLDILRPEILPAHLPESQDSVNFEPHAGGYLWRTEFGNFGHVGDGPRGWVTPLCLSPDGLFSLIPGNDQMALLSLDPAQSYTAFFSFEGRMRAGCILDQNVYLVNSQGRVFTGNYSSSGSGQPDQ